MDSRRRSHREPTVSLWNSRPTPRNFLAASKAQALKGLKIVLSMTLRDKLALLFACILIVSISYVYVESRAAGLRTINVSEHLSKVSSPQITETAVLHLQRPQRPFHGNHWYHIGEYYISRQELIHQLLSRHTAKYPIRHLKLVVYDYRLTKTMTKMSFSLIVLSCLGQLSVEQRNNILSIELYAPKSPHYFVESEYIKDITNIHNGTVLTMIENQPPLFGYYHINSDKVQFIKYAESGTYVNRKTLFEGGTNYYNMLHQPSTSLLHSITNWMPAWRLNPVDKSYYCSKHPCRDAVHVGSIGDSPIAPVDWFQSAIQADHFRAQALSMCQIEQHAQVDFDAVQRTYTMIVYQRDLNRRFIHLNKVIETLKSDTIEGVKWNIEVLRHRENMDPCALIKAFHSADILLTAHGFQSTASMFMKKGAVIIEIFPYKYHRTTYLPLSRVFGLHYRSIQNAAPASHSSSSFYKKIVSTIDANTPSTQLLKVISQGACMRDLKCRSYARSRDISMPHSHIELVLHTMWQVATDSLDPYAPTML